MNRDQVKQAAETIRTTFANEENLVDCLQSFNRAVDQAGGKLFGLEELQSMSLYDFIANIAANNHIRFHCDKPNKQA